MEVCIVGGGISGISCCKLALDYGLVPFVLNKTSHPCGIWARPDSEIGVWDRLETTTSKYLFAFSDQLWNPDDPVFPLWSQVYDYFNNYMIKHNLYQYFSFNCEVISIERSEENYLVKWKTQETIHEKIFKYVILATGRYSKPNTPFKNISEFKGEVIISGHYRNSEIFTNKKVLIIGRNVTSSEIALEALQTAASVTLVFRTSGFIVFKKHNNYPLDMQMTNIFFSTKPTNLISSIQENNELMKYACKTFGNPGKYSPELYIDENSQSFQQQYFNSQNFLDAVADGRIGLIKGEVEDFYENGIYLKTGEKIEADVVVAGTGYLTDFSFLSEEIKRIINYDAENANMPTILYRGMFHPELKGLAFAVPRMTPVGGRFELYAEICVRYLLGMLDLTEEEINQGIQIEMKVRNNIEEKLSFSFIALKQDMLKLLGKNIDYDFIRNELQFSNGPVLPQFLYMDKPEIRELCFEVVREIKEKFPFIEFN
ncbi:hypothetical protein SteCoe_3119 [Stentor coeruleus]|uniref:Flavin-containing monooxygenase n=1 Tax=Stentor coeruleus TaxID=5963 RepID=A0A1R2CXR2_9CILI|nr:hypothetical protein SteCoe_3119 [Stentor coeruleus]